MTRGAAQRRKEPLRVRRAVPEDMTRVADILRSTADWYEPLLDPKDMQEHDVDEGWAERNYERREFYVGVEPDDSVVGTVSLQAAGEYAYLGYIYLLANRVGRGYGQRLLRFAAETSRRRGYRALVLIAHPDAKWAVKAYRRFGFRVIAERRREVLRWNHGWLRPYYEEGFQLFSYQLREVV